MKIDDFYQNYQPNFLNDDGVIRRSIIMAESALDAVEQRSSPIQIVDMGCGSGQFGRALELVRARRGLSRQSYVLTGTDMGAFVEQNEWYDFTARCDLERSWPFEDGSVDIVYMGAVLEHIFDYHAQFNEANRVLKLDGLFLFDVPNLGNFVNTVQLIMRQQPYWIVDMQHIHGYTLGFLRKLASWHGFNVESAEASNLFGLGSLAPRALYRALASWGTCLCMVCQKRENMFVTDSRLKHLFGGNYEEIDSRTIRVL